MDHNITLTMIHTMNKTIILQR